MSVEGSSRWTAAYICSALSTSMRCTPGGVSIDTGPLISVTRAPAKYAACATAKPIFPELRLLMKRTGSIRSRVGPAVMTTCRPSSTRGVESSPSRALCEIERLEHASRSNLTAGLVTFARPIDGDAACAQRRDVRLRRCIRPHQLVHRRRDRDRRIRREAQSAEQIVGETLREPRNEVGAGRGNQHQLGPARELDVAHGRFGHVVPEIGPHRATGDRLKGERRHEFLCRRSHDDLDLRAAFSQTTHEIRDSCTPRCRR